MGHQSSSPTTKRHNVYIAGGGRGSAQVHPSRAHPGRYFFDVLRKRSRPLDKEEHMDLHALVEEDDEGCMTCLVYRFHFIPLGFERALGMHDQAVKVAPNPPPRTEWASDLPIRPVIAVADLHTLQPAEHVAALVVPAFLVRINILRIYLINT